MRGIKVSEITLGLKTPSVPNFFESKERIIRFLKSQSALPKEQRVINKEVMELFERTKKLEAGDITSQGNEQEKESK